jgi:thioredoxin reductase
MHARVFGHVMGFWERQMPKGMLVRSGWEASHISDPHGSLTLDAYEAAQPQRFARPILGEEFCRYGRWFQARAAPDLDERMIANVEKRDEDSFVLTTEDDERVTAGRVVIATGLRRFAEVPPQFRTLESDRAIHCVDIPDPTRFAGQSVAVIGSGQSAIETAVLVREAKAEVELIARASLIRWLATDGRRGLLGPYVQRLLYAPTGVGPAGLSWIVSMPRLFKSLPPSWQERAAYRSIRPAATGWLFDRMSGVKVTLERQVSEARANGDGVHLSLDDGTSRQVDNVLLGTGYKIDIAEEPIVGESIRKRLRVHDGYPVLGTGFESSVPGLHFVGAYSAHSFGPVMRFVAGTRSTAQAVTRRIAGAA